MPAYIFLIELCHFSAQLLHFPAACSVTHWPRHVNRITVRAIAACSETFIAELKGHFRFARAPFFMAGTTSFLPPLLLEVRLVAYTVSHQSSGASLSASFMKLVLLLYFIDEPFDGVRCIALGDGKVVPP